MLQDAPHDPIERALALWGPAQPEPEGLFRKDDRPRVLVEGDSWVRKPRDLIIAGPPETITGWLETWGRWNLTNIGSPGDEAVAMLAGAAKLSLCERLDREHYDVILFSGGGNDIVGAYDFYRFILPRDQTASAIDWPRLEDATTQIILAYKLLIDLVRSSKSNSGTPIVTHTYDLAIPSPQGATFLRGALKFQKGRSWMFPYLLAKGWTDPGEQREIVATLLRQFKNALINLSLEVGDAQGFHVVDTHGTLLEGDWKDEIHGTSEGFEKIAHKIEAEMIRVSLRKPAEREVAAPRRPWSWPLSVAEMAEREEAAELCDQPAKPAWTGADVIENAAEGSSSEKHTVRCAWCSAELLLPSGKMLLDGKRSDTLAAEREALLASLRADADRRAAEECAAKVEAMLRRALVSNERHTIAQDRRDGIRLELKRLLAALPEVLKP